MSEERGKRGRPQFSGSEQPKRGKLRERDCGREGREGGRRKGKGGGKRENGAIGQKQDREAIFPESP